LFLHNAASLQDKFLGAAKVALMIAHSSDAIALISTPRQSRNMMSSKLGKTARGKRQCPLWSA
jgi:hypothetical protein